MKFFNFTFSNIKKITIALAVVILVFTCLDYVSAGTASQAVDGLNQAANKGFYNNDGKGDLDPNGTVMTNIPVAIGKLIGLVLQFIGLAFFVLMIYGGFLWMFARGNDTQVQKAKDLIQSAVIGLIIVLAAYAITYFIGNALTGGA